MAIKYYAGQIAIGTSTERTGGTWTGSPAGYRFVETDTNKVFIWSGSAWAEQTVTNTALSGTLTVSQGGTGATTLTGILKGAGTGAITAATPLAVADGGTGAATLTGILKGNGTSAVTVLTDPLPIANGGTSGATATAGFDALSPMSAVGDLIVGSTAGTRVRLARGSANQPLKVNSGGTDLDYGTLPVGGGGSGATTLTGILIGNGTSAFSTVTAPSGTVVGTSDSQTLTNKTQDAASNTFSNIHVFPSIKRTGSYQPMATNSGATGMCQGNLTTIAVGTGTSGSHTITSAGGRFSYTTGTTINSLCGVRGSAVLNLERDLNCYLKAKFANTTAVTTLRSFVGFTSSSSAPASGADPLPNLSGVGFWFDSGVHASNIAIAQNNGGASSDITTLANVGTMDTSPHVYALRADNANTKFQYSFDGGAWTDVNTTIPAANTPLGWTCYTECLANSAARIMAVYYVEIGCDSP